MGVTCGEDKVLEGREEGQGGPDGEDPREEGAHAGPEQSKEERAKPVAKGIEGKI